MPETKNIFSNLSTHLEQLYFGGNWTASNVSDVLKDVTKEEALAKISDCNTIAVLTFHINYYVDSILKVLNGGPLDSKDELSFDHPPILVERDWLKLRSKCLDQARELTIKIKSLQRDLIDADFVNARYGSYSRNILGLIEHTHYHLGQISILKKLIRSGG